MNREEMLALTNAIGQFRHDPLAFVRFAFPWGKGAMKDAKGPEEWQVKLLSEIRDGLKTTNQVIHEAVASGHGIGKLLVMDTVIETPTGKRVWGTLKPGDLVFGSDGKPTRVLGCRYYESVPIYRVRFDDGTFCDVSSGHLWKVRGRQERRNKRDSWRVMSTLDILKKGVKRANGEAKSRQWEIPVQGAAEFPQQEVPVHPYLMGIWLGDGHKSQPSYTKPYLEIKENIEQLGYSVTAEKNGKAFYIKGAYKEFQQLDVYNKTSSERYIPDDYLYNDIESRKALLCGLMDSDGEVNKAHSLMYSTTSKKLAGNVLWLVRSLGGKAQMQPTDKQGWYYKEGVRHDGKICYRITMTLPFNPFSLKHRKERYKQNIEHRYMCRWIDSIEYIGEKAGQCIEVENSDGLYLANDFIVTHNSAMVSWLILWAISTFPDTRGVVTANTDSQLKTKTWPELSKWYNRFIAKDLFVFTATAIFSAETTHQKNWRIDAIPWSENNPEAFAGLHNQGKRILLLFDEASAIPDIIWEVAEGAMTDDDTEIVWAVFGNPTRNTGRFFDCFHRDRKFWNVQQVDSRTVSFSNKAQMNMWIESRGLDSDFVKVRVLGQFPSASEWQFIPRSLVDNARGKHLQQQQYSFAPVIIGVDPAWTGGDEIAIVKRQGLASWILATYQKNDNDYELASRIAAFEDEHKADAVFIDMGYGTGVYSAGKVMGRNWQLVGFGSKSPDIGYYNLRAYGWGKLKEWLVEGGAIPDNQQLCDDLTAPETKPRDDGKIQLESKDSMKKRGLASPNIGDALAITFMRPVIRQDRKKAQWANNEPYEMFGYAEGE